MKNLGYHLILLGVLLGISLSSFAQLMPLPYTMDVQSGKFRLETDFSIAIQAESAGFVYDRADDFLRRLMGRTGLFIQQERITPDQVNPSHAKMQVYCENKGRLELGMDESYTLEVSSSAVVLQAKTSYGALHGFETLLQLIEADEEGYYLPAVQIKDQPRFPWRGLLIDPARHWLPVEVILRNIDGMAAVKMNVLHLHLTEDQGFRIESKVYPKLHEMGGEGRYYTQQQMKEIIQYAADRGIRVVPEFDIPGHATSWLVGYPELATLPGEYVIEREWGVMDPVLDPSKESTYTFLDNFLGEMASLFPDAYLHIGGDENNGKHWNQSEHIQAFKKEHNIQDNHELQALFNQRIYEILSKNGKQMVGWDEIQHPEIPKNVVIQSWRGQKGLAAAAKAGYPVMLSNGYYIDLIQPASFHYLNDPLPDDIGLTEAERKLVLGGEATMWGEQVTEETIDSRIWPRTAAIAERLWSRAEVKDVESMYNRMEAISLQLEEHGLAHEKNYEMMLRRLCRSHDVAALRLLADVCEPVKGYRRNALSEVNALMPYTRFIDATRPDAKTARDFNQIILKWVTDDLVDQAVDYKPYSLLKSQLTNWYANHNQLVMVIDKNPILQEVKPLADNLNRLAFIGLQALEYIQEGSPAKTEWIEFALQVCEDAQTPYGETELMILPGIIALLEACR